MPLVVVAALDQTGLVIHLLTAGLIAIAVALVLLTIWYWRYTKPLEATIPPLELIPLGASPAGEPAGSEVEPVPLPAPTLELPEVNEPIEAGKAIVVDWSAPIEPIHDPVVDPVHEHVERDPIGPVAHEAGDEQPEREGQDGEGGHFGLDDEQWEVLAQAVLDNYLEPVVESDS